MKKHLVLISTLLLIIESAFVLLTFSACSPWHNYDVQIPSNGIFEAPKNFYLEWDIPSVRDITVKQDGYYSMPVYKFSTYEEFIHLKDIVGMRSIGSEVNNTEYCEVCKSSVTCIHDRYNEEFFKEYILLIGWHQYAGVVIPEHVQQGTEGAESAKNVATYTIDYNGSLVVYLKGVEADTTETTGQWIFVAVHKSQIKNSIAFLVELPDSVLPEEELPNEELPNEELPNEEIPEE